MRESNFRSVVSNRAAVSITTTLYDRRALDCTADKPLVNSLNHLTYLTYSAVRVRETLCTDGGLERLVAILKSCRDDCNDGHPLANSKEGQTLIAWKWTLAFQCLVFLGTRGTEQARKRIVEAGLIPVICSVLDNFLYTMRQMKGSQSRSSCGHRRQLAQTTQTQLDGEPVPDRQHGSQHQGTHQSQPHLAINAAASSATVGDGSDGSSQYYQRERDHDADTRSIASLSSTVSTISSASTASVMPVAPPSVIRNISSTSTSTSSSGSVMDTHGDHIRPSTHLSTSANAASFAHNMIQQTVTANILRSALPNPPLLHSPASNAVFHAHARVNEFNHEHHQHNDVAAGAAAPATAGPIQNVFAAAPVNVNVTANANNYAPAVRQQTVISQPAAITTTRANTNIDQSDSESINTTSLTDFEDVVTESIPVIEESQGAELSWNDQSQVRLPRPPQGAGRPATGVVVDGTSRTNINMSGAASAVSAATGTTSTSGSIPRYFNNHVIVPRDEDVIWGLQILAFVSKYAYLKPQLQQTHLVPQLSMREKDEPPLVKCDKHHRRHHHRYDAYCYDNCEREMAGEGARCHHHHHRDGYMEGVEDDVDLMDFEEESFMGQSVDPCGGVNADNTSWDYDEYDFSANTDVDAEFKGEELNIFPLVEPFTLDEFPKEIRYWAGVVMRNSCRKDESRGGIRQCANFDCGKWEEYPRQFAKCRRCKRTKYCSKACQLSAWTLHRKWCLPSNSTGSVSSNGSASTASTRTTANSGILPATTINFAPISTPTPQIQSSVTTPVSHTPGPAQTASTAASPQGAWNA